MNGLRFKLFINLMAICLFALVQKSHADFFQNIGPLDTLGDIKIKMPKATYEKIDAAWTKESEVLYKISGTGLNGTIVVKFDDYRPEYKGKIDTLAEDTTFEATPENINYLKELSAYAFETDENALTVGWIRWVPYGKIPVKRFILKYGKPDKTGFADSDLQPYKEWSKKGFTVSLSDDEKFVLGVDYTFTDDDYRIAYKEKYGIVPVWLETKKPATRVKTKKQKK